MKLRNRTVLILTGFFVLCSAALGAEPAAKDAGESYLRITRDEKDVPQTLQTAIVHCVPAAKGKRRPTVDLISAVHVADKDYYDELNRRFAKYDVVLYELVAPKGTKIPKGGRTGGGSPVSFIQKGMKDMLDLEFQLEAVDYTAKNFVHADMSPEQFSESMKRKGESVFSIFMRMMGYAMAQQGNPNTKNSDMQILMALFDKNRSLALKRAMAEQFEDMEGAMLVIEGPDGSTLISERNKVALKVLREQIEAGKKKIAIFYGGGHMADFQQRLKDDFGLVPASTEWIDAWDMK